MALPVMHLAADDLFRQIAEVKKKLTLTANQESLWQQQEAKAHVILRIRQSRRDQLQEELKHRLADNQVELRDLAKKIDTETALSLPEDQQLRELWLTMNDALDDHQRLVIAQFLIGELQRVPDPINEKSHTDSNKPREDERSHNKPRRRTGGVDLLN